MNSSLLFLLILQTVHNLLSKTFAEVSFETAREFITLKLSNNLLCFVCSFSFFLHAIYKIIEIDSHLNLLCFRTDNLNGFVTINIGFEICFCIIEICNRIEKSCISNIDFLELQENFVINLNFSCFVDSYTVLFAQHINHLSSIICFTIESRTFLKFQDCLNLFDDLLAVHAVPD